MIKKGFFINTLMALLLILLLYTNGFAQPKISFLKTEHDFGGVKQEQTLTQTFKFKNIGNEILSITDVKTD